MGFISRWLPPRKLLRTHIHAEPLPRRTPPAPGEKILHAHEISKNFGGLAAVQNVSFDLHAREILALIGPNGAGKSTIFNLLTGLVPVDHGAIYFVGQRIDTLSTPRIAGLGMARTFQHLMIQPKMSVLENVAVGAHLRGRSGFVAAATRLERREEARLLYDALGQLKRVGIEDCAALPAGSLALGQQRLVEIARALAADPKLLLLDEPAAGLRFGEKQKLAALLQQLRAEGLSVLLVEHDMNFVMKLVDRVVVVDFGVKLAEGTPAEVRENSQVIEAYLGGIEDEQPLHAARPKAAS